MVIIRICNMISKKMRIKMNNKSRIKPELEYSKIKEIKLIKKNLNRLNILIIIKDMKKLLILIGIPQINSELNYILQTKKGDGTIEVQGILKLNMLDFSNIK